MTVEVAALPYTLPPLGSVSVIGKPLCIIMMPVSDQPFSAPCAAAGN